jgi:hypothetical protein
MLLTGVQSPNSSFRDLARAEFAFLTATRGMTASAWDEGPGISHVEYKGARLTIRLSYEPFGPPWCDIKDSDGRHHHRLSVTADDPTAATLATAQGSTFDTDLLDRHRRAIAEWLSRARPILEGWLKEHAQ